MRVKNELPRFGKMEHRVMVCIAQQTKEIKMLRQDIWQAVPEYEAILLSTLR